MPTAFAQTVEARFAELTPTSKRVASYMLANLDRLGLENADQIAQQAGTSGISVGRFLRSIGYQNLDDLKRELIRKEEPVFEAVAFQGNAADRDGDDLAAAGGGGIDEDALGRIAGGAEQEPRDEGLAGELEGIGGHFILRTSHE